jgi:hypothetical protein
MQPLILLPLLATALSLVSAQPFPRQQRDNDDSDISVSLGPIRVGATTGLLAARSADPPFSIAEDENALKQRDNDDQSSQLVALRRQSQDPSEILRQVLHFPTDIWTAAADVLEKLPGKS